MERKVSPLNRKTSVILTNGSFVQNPALQDLTLTLKSTMARDFTTCVIPPCWMGKCTCAAREVPVRCSEDVSMSSGTLVRGGFRIPGPCR